MKVLIVNGEDYSALHFENAHKGALVSDIIDNPENYQPTGDDEYKTWELTIKEVEGPVSDEFVTFVKSQMDYESMKHDCWFTEHEII